MQRTLPGVTRYFDNPGTRVVPVGILGTETLFPVREEAFRPVRIEAYVGQPLEADALRAGVKDNRRLMMDCVGFAIAHLLPREYRGVYDDNSPEMEEARPLSRTQRMSVVFPDPLHAADQSRSNAASTGIGTKRRSPSVV